MAIIDGFAGPGEYREGEEGSPVIILHTVLTHKLRPAFPEILVLFIEKESKFADHLERLLERRFPQPLQGVEYEVVKGEFAPVLESILVNPREKGRQLIPCFAFVDPFGISGIPMALLAQFMEHRYSEILVNFAFDAVNRRLLNRQFERHFDDLFGCTQWREVRLLKGQSRHRALHQLYVDQLRRLAGAKFTLSFCMRDANNRKLYYLIFATKHIDGFDEMKKAMWKADPAGGLQFSDYAYDPDQLRLFPPEPDFSDLAEFIFAHFRGRQVSTPVVEKWVVAHTRQYARNHVRRALTVLQESGRLRKFRGGEEYTRKGASPNDILLRFSL